MAKRKPNRAPLLIFLGLAVGVLAVAGWWTLHDLNAEPAAHTAIAVPPLPTGALEQMAFSVSDVRYLAVDQTHPVGDGFDATILIVGKSPTGISRRYAMVVRREILDCKQSRIFNEMAGEYDATGKLLNYELLSGTAGRPVEASDQEAGRLCGKGPKPALRRVIGFKAAQREVQSAPDDLFATADAHPDDADAWAWVCAAGAHGHWRPSMPADCDRAVSLQPKSAATLLDRAFLKLKIGKLPGADADFAKALTLDPQNATAIFGHSLVAAMRGDMAASKAQRTRALAIDPSVPDWIQGTYMFQIGREYEAP